MPKENKSKNEKVKQKIGTTAIQSEETAQGLLADLNYISIEIADLRREITNKLSELKTLTIANTSLKNQLRDEKDATNANKLQTQILRSDELIAKCIEDINDYKVKLNPRSDALIELVTKRLIDDKNNKLHKDWEKKLRDKSKSPEEIQALREALSALKTLKKEKPDPKLESSRVLYEIVITQLLIDGKNNNRYLELNLEDTRKVNMVATHLTTGEGGRNNEEWKEVKTNKKKLLERMGLLKFHHEQYLKAEEKAKQEVLQKKDQPVEVQSGPPILPGLHASSSPVLSPTSVATPLPIANAVSAAAPAREKPPATIAPPPSDPPKLAIPLAASQQLGAESTSRNKPPEIALSPAPAMPPRPIYPVPELAQSTAAGSKTPSPAVLAPGSVASSAAPAASGNLAPLPIAIAVPPAYPIPAALRERGEFPNFSRRNSEDYSMRLRPYPESLRYTSSYPPSPRSSVDFSLDPPFPQSPIAFSLYPTSPQPPEPYSPPPSSRSLGSASPPASPRPLASASAPSSPRPLGSTSPPASPRPVASASPPASPQPLGSASPPASPQPLASASPPPSPQPLGSASPPASPQPLASASPPPTPRSPPVPPASSLDSSLERPIPPAPGGAAAPAPATPTVSISLKTAGEMKQANNEKIAAIDEYINNIDRLILDHSEKNIRVNTAMIARATYVQMNNMLDKAASTKLNNSDKSLMESYAQKIKEYEKIMEMQNQVDERTLGTTQLQETIIRTVNKKTSDTIKRGALSKIVENYPNINAKKEALEQRLGNTREPLSINEKRELQTCKDEIQGLKDAGVLDKVVNFHQKFQEKETLRRNLIQTSQLFISSHQQQQAVEASAGRRANPPGFSSQPTQKDLAVMLKRINWVHDACKPSEGYTINEDLHKNSYEVSNPQQNISYKATHSGVESHNASDACLNLMAKDLARCYVEKVIAGEIKPATTTDAGKNNFITLNAAPDVEKKFAQAVYQALAAELTNPKNNETNIKITLEQALKKIEIKNSANVNITHPRGFPSNMTVETPAPNAAPVNVRTTPTSVTRLAAANNAARLLEEQSPLAGAARQSQTSRTPGGGSGTTS